MRTIYSSLLLGIIISFAGCKHQYKLTESKSSNTVIDSELSTDLFSEDLISPYRSQLNAKMDEVLNTSLVDMEIGTPEGILGNFICDLTMARGIKETNGAADFCILNNGGLRTSLPKGEVTRGKIYEIMPFQNEIVVLELTGEKVAELIKYIHKLSVMTSNRKAGVPVSNLNLKLGGSKITEALIAGKPFDPSKNYKVVTSDYLAGGGDSMDFFLNPVNTIKTGILLRDAIIEHIIQLKSINQPINGALDGRIYHAE